MSPLPDTFYHYSAIVLLAVDMITLFYILVAELIVRPRMKPKPVAKCSSSSRRNSVSPTRAADPRRFSTQSYKFPVATKACPSVLLHTKLRMMINVFYIVFCLVIVVVPTFLVVMRGDFSLTIYLTIIIGLIFLSTFVAELLHMGGKGLWLPHAEDVMFKTELKALEAVRRERKGEFTLPQCGWTAGTTTYNPSNNTSHPHNASATGVNKDSSETGATAVEGQQAKAIEPMTLEREAPSSAGGDTERGDRDSRQAGIFRKAVRRIIFEEMYCVPYLVLVVPFLTILVVRYAP